MSLFVMESGGGEWEFIQFHEVPVDISKDYMLASV